MKFYDMLKSVIRSTEKEKLLQTNGNRGSTINDGTTRAYVSANDSKQTIVLQLVP